MSRFCVELLCANQSSWFITKIFVFVSFFIVFITAEVCTKVNPCRCEFRNGSVIDLERVGSHGKARWENIKPRNKTDNSTYYYNPCFDFKLPSGASVSENQCADGVAVCQASKLFYHSFGSQQTAEFQWSPKDNTLQLCYIHKTKMAFITLKCNENPKAKDELVVWGEVNSQVNMTLTSRCACPDACGHSGLSAGSTLVILFSVFVILYLVFGMVFNKLTRGAQGWELIPNYEFWQDFPLLVRDGCVYVASGCKPDTTYERI